MISVLPDAAARIERELLESIPLARAMQLRVGQCDAASLTLHAPLAPNINDKGCAFGGSLTSLMTLACWSLIRVVADAREVTADIYVQDSQVRYLAPVWGDFSVVARLADGESFERFFEALDERGRGRLTVECVVPAANGEPAATLSARFVAIVSSKAAST